MSNLPNFPTYNPSWGVVNFGPPVFPSQQPMVNAGSCGLNFPMAPPQFNWSFPPGAYPTGWMNQESGKAKSFWEKYKSFLIIGGAIIIFIILLFVFMQRKGPSCTPCPQCPSPNEKQNTPVLSAAVPSASQFNHLI